LAGIYIHIPYCKQACHYCDFHFSTNLGSRTGFIQALKKEIGLQKDFLNGEPVDTIYFGGGTPSLLSSEELGGILDKIYNHFSITSPEITLECNPDDLSKEKLAELKCLGINRLSIGIQTFDDELLSFLNRAHNSKQAVSCFNLARQAGFDNISTDLIFALPGTDHSALAADLKKFIELDPEHISCYQLTVEEKTVLGRWRNSGKFLEMDDSFSAEQFSFVIESLEKKGYEHYEISNYSRPGYQSRHNSNYWKGISYLGVGPSAHSFNGEYRQSNVSNNSNYIKSIAEDKIPAEIETLTLNEKINEYLLTGLRTIWGCDLKFLRNKFDIDLLNLNKKTIEILLRNELITTDNEILKLTAKGKFFADKISSDLFLTE
jgi:oxygen-independent coproporphyrinogen III oxidase